MKRRILGAVLAVLSVAACGAEDVPNYGIDTAHCLDNQTASYSNPDGTRTAVLCHGLDGCYEDPSTHRVDCDTSSDYPGDPCTVANVAQCYNGMSYELLCDGEKWVKNACPGGCYNRDQQIYCFEHNDGSAQAAGF